MIHAVCIYNPRAGRALAGSDAIRARLRPRGYEIELRATTHPFHAAELALEAVSNCADLVIAAGGDGTINEVACGLALSQVPMAILPCGTANVLAKELRLPERMLDVIDLIPGLKPMRIAIGKGGKRYFVLMAGVGIDAQIVYELGATAKSAGDLGFWLEALRHWTKYKFTRFSVTVDGTRCDATFAMISRVASYAGGVSVTPRADLRGDLFDVCLFTGTSRVDYVRYLSGVLSGTHPHFHDVVYLHGRLVEMTSAEQVRVQMDGEIVGKLPMDFQIVPDALSLMVPPEMLGRNTPC